MYISKKFHFYAAHRNAEVGGKCANIHGHVYRVELSVQQPRSPVTPSVTILFEDLDRIINQVKEQFDHALLLYYHDPAKAILQQEGSGAGKLLLTWHETSAENIALLLLSKFKAFNLNVKSLTLHETESSSITVTPDDIGK
jgi:6-pyruvoyltetrahydropterin/6-carboxytetrahydropterin synthase